MSAVLAATLTTGEGNVGGLNIAVETLSGKSGVLLGGTLSFIPLGFAFGAGMVSAVNPCGFAMLPAYLGLYLGDHEKQRSHTFTFSQLARSLQVGSMVTIGFVLMFGLAGVVIGGGLRSLASIVPWLGLSIGVLLTFVGAWLLTGGKLYSGLAARAAARIGNPSQVGVRGYFLFGVSYGTASLSCTLPIFLAVVGNALAVGGLALVLGQFVLYALGMGLVVMLLTVVIGLFKGALVGRLRRTLPYVQPVSALLMVLAGSYIVFYWLSIGGLLSRIP